MLCQSNRPKTIRRHASRHSWFGLPFRIPRTPSQLRYSPAPIEAPSRLAATSSALRRAPSYEGRRCVDSALCKRRRTMAPTELAESPPSAPSLAARSSRLVRPAFGYATPQLRPCLRFTPTRSGHATLASVARGRSASDAWYPLPLVPVIAEARLIDARFHTRTTRRPVSSYREPWSALLCFTGRRAPLAEDADRRLTIFLAFNDARRPRRSTVHPR